MAKDKDPVQSRTGSDKLRPSVMHRRLSQVRSGHLMTVSVRKNQQKLWTRAGHDDSVCLCAIGVSCIASIGTMAYKMSLLAKKHCLRPTSASIKWHLLDGIEVLHEFADHAAIKQLNLKSKLDENNLMVKRCTARFCSSYAHRGNFVKKRHHPARMRQCAVPTGAGRAQKGAGTAVLNPLPKLTV